jgi:hypothetical protein
LIRRVGRAGRPLLPEALEELATVVTALDPLLLEAAGLLPEHARAPSATAPKTQLRTRNSDFPMCRPPAVMRGPCRGDYGFA